ncbi:Transmembrane channel-like protein 5 [Merluccius polli]|uniref:Transmembrane channel-like protein n=1 Tax=Merluccius polli TaxID=89951 RepID=A0AA47MU25_MERPO|nr:Transmembrane channel-like protein 5 [Merluccius polli]
MTHYSNGAFYNPAYHESETLELDRRSPRKPHHSNPYAQEEPAWQAERANVFPTVTGQRGRSDDSAWRVPWEGGQEEESRWGRERLPMGHLPTHPQSPPWQQAAPNHNAFGIVSTAYRDASAPSRFPTKYSANMTMRWRGLRRMSMFVNGEPTHLSITEDAIRNELEQEEQNLVKDLVACSTKDRIQGIKELPMSYEEKKHIRSQVLAFKSSKKSRHLSCFADCSDNVSLSFRRCGSGMASTRQTLELWQGTMKEIGGRFGTSVLSYFLFLKSLFMLNVFSFLINFGFITIPMLAYNQIPQNVTFRGLELLTGAGYFNYTVMYYGSYGSDIIKGLLDYNMQLAYFFTIAAYMSFLLCCCIPTAWPTHSKQTTSCQTPVAGGSWQLLCSWDFSVTNEKAVRQRKNNLRVQLKETLSEKTQGEGLTTAERMKHFGVQLGAWFISTSLAVGCGSAIYFLSQYEQRQTTDTDNWSLLQEAETLLVPFVVSLINLVVPLFYSLFNKFELYSNQRRQIYALIFRNVLLKMSILGILCYYWMKEVATKFSCWESMVGQALYRLVIVDFFFLMLGSFFGEFLSKYVACFEFTGHENLTALYFSVIGTRWFPRLGVPEFDVARNVLDLIYAQTLAWIGIYFSPLLPVSLMQNCQPPRRVGRAAQMRTIFIALLFFPSFVGSLSMMAYTFWSLTPSKHCGPFQGLNNTFSIVESWVTDLEDISTASWVVWIYQNVIRSEIFYFLITIIILFITFIFWQVTQGRKLLILLLRQQIINEGKDKTFLLEKLQTLQKSQPNNKSKTQIKQSKRRSDGSSSGVRSNSNAMVQTFLAGQQQNRGNYFCDVPVPSDISTSYQRIPIASDRQSSSDALTLAMQARQRAEVQDYRTPSTLASPLVQVMQARQDYGRQADAMDDSSSSMSNIMMQVMEARMRAEEGYGVQGRPVATESSVPARSSALIQAMLARQQSQNEYDDGY